MNRREALAALVSLPPTTRISVARLQPDDVIVLECESSLSMKVVEHLKTHMEAVWPGRKVVVLADGLKLSIVSGDIA